MSDFFFKDYPSIVEQIQKNTGIECHVVDDPVFQVENDTLEMYTRKGVIRFRDQSEIEAIIVNELSDFIKENNVKIIYLYQYGTYQIRSDMMALLYRFHAIT